MFTSRVRRFAAPAIGYVGTGLRVFSPSPFSPSPGSPRVEHPDPRIQVVGELRLEPPDAPEFSMGGREICIPAARDRRVKPLSFAAMLREDEGGVPRYPRGAATAGPSRNGSRSDRGATSGVFNSTRRRKQPMGRAISSVSPGLSPTAIAMIDTAQAGRLSMARSPPLLTEASFSRLGYWIVDRRPAARRSPKSAMGSARI